jgi:hypothetical protein
MVRHSRTKRPIAQVAGSAIGRKRQVRAVRQQVAVIRQAQLQRRSSVPMVFTTVVPIGRQVARASNVELVIVKPSKPRPRVMVIDGRGARTVR